MAFGSQSFLVFVCNVLMQVVLADRSQMITLPRVSHMLIQYINWSPTAGSSSLLPSGGTRRRAMSAVLAGAIRTKLDRSRVRRMGLCQAFGPSPFMKRCQIF
jgi:hypothetical protein